MVWWYVFLLLFSLEGDRVAAVLPASCVVACSLSVQHALLTAPFNFLHC